MITDAPASALARPYRQSEHLPGLDGLRAIAVLAVIAYHGELGWARGGFLGVEVFFVVSGFLITRLLAAEAARDGQVDLKRFWLRRGRRLLPALFTMLFVVTTYTVVFHADEVSRLRGDVLAAVAYVSNWFQIWSGHSYFAQLGRPSPFRHLWSLGVEEQFYLFWPLLLLGLALVTRGRRRIMAGLLVVLAGASAWRMATMFDPLVDPNRIYLGTDTRLSGLFLGAAAGLLWRPESPRLASQKTSIETTAAIATALMVLAMWRIESTSPLLYRGGFFAVGLATVAIIAAGTLPGSRFTQVLSWRPLQAIGVRSYGLYLWHWPVLVFTKSGQDTHLSGVTLWAVRAALTVALSEACYRFIETPVRRGALERWWGRYRQTRGSAEHTREALPLLAVCFVVALLAVAVAAEPARINEITASIEAGQAVLAAQSSQPTPLPTSTVPIDSDTSATVPVSTVDPTATTIAPVDPAATTAVGSSDPAATVDPAVSADPAATTVVAAAVPTEAPTVAPTDAPTVPPLPRITAVGDSVMLGAAPALLARLGDSITIDAMVSRAFINGIATLQAIRDAGTLGDIVVVHLGNNGPVTDKLVDQLMTVVGDRQAVYLVTCRVTRSWQDDVNKTLLAATARYPNVKIIDWKTASEDHPEYLYRDGTHMRPDGAAVYAELVATSMGR